MSKVRRAAPPLNADQSTSATLAADDARQRLTDAAAQLGLQVTEGELSQLLAYRDLLLRWNRVYNLTALRDPAEVLSHHLIDCLAVVPALRRHAAGRPLRVLDVGSGGGLPGVVLAMLQPNWRLTCVDTVAKKAAFIRQAAGELRLANLSAVHSRIEAMRIAKAAAPVRVRQGAGEDAGLMCGTGAATGMTAAQAAGQAADGTVSLAAHPMAGRSQFDLITSRAFASLPDFVALTADLLAPQGVWAAMKGKPTNEELSAVPVEADLFHVEPIHVPGLDAKRCLVWMRRRTAS